MDTIGPRKPNQRANLSLIEGGVPRDWQQQLADVEAVMLEALAEIRTCQEAIAERNDTGQLAEGLADLASAIRSAALLRCLWEVEAKTACSTPRPGHLRSV